MFPHSTPRTTLGFNLHQIRGAASCAACGLMCSRQKRRNFGERVLSNFITNTMAAIFYFNGSGRLGREINLYQGGGRRSKIRRGVGVWFFFFFIFCFLFISLPPSPTPTVHSNCKSNMADQINDRELLTLPRTNKTPDCPNFQTPRRVTIRCKNMKPMHEWWF